MSAYLAGLEFAYRKWVEGEQLPAPLSDVDLGPTPGLDLYVRDRGLWLQAELDPPLTAHGASLHCLARKSGEPGHQAAACVAQAILARASGSEGPGVREALGGAMARRLVGDSTRGWSVRGDYQANPHRSPVRRERSPDAAGGSAFWEQATTQLGLANVGELAVALASLSPSPTRNGSPRWNNRPDSLDALRWGLGGNPADEAQFVLELAIARAAGGSGVPSSAAAVRFDWRVPASSLPRNLGARRPLEPYGAAYLWLDLDVAVHSPLLVRCEWEGPVDMQWAALAVDGKGRLARRLDLTFVQGARSAERVVESLESARGLAIVGVNLGAVDTAHPFDPDHEPWEAHGFTVYLTELESRPAGAQVEPGPSDE